MKKLFALLLAVAMVVSMAACGSTTPENTTAAGGNATNGTGAPGEYVNPYADLAEDYDALSEAIYNDILGEFATAYEAALAATNVSERFALMAVAEAKLLETGVMLPLTSNGGNYAISRAVPNTVTSTLWGNDSYRYHNILVATEPLKAADRDTLKAKWAELKGTGTWEAEAKKLVEGMGYTLTDKYTIGYSSDPQTWDVLATSRAADSEAIVNTYDGLVEYDSENVMQPALAESWEVSEDGLTYTFKIREGQKWVDAQGREVADVKADDFVAGLQHMMDAMGGLEYLVQGLIVNADEYINGEVTDFAEVGVKAVDDTTLVYTLTNDATYFMTMLGYGCFAPMSRTYYESQGGKFGAEYDSSAESYTYGKTPNNIAYCGPYLVTNATEKNTVVFEANTKYWNAENVEIKTLTWLYNDGSDQTKAYNDMKNGVIDACGLNSSSLALAKTEGLFEDYSYVTSCNAVSYMAFYNVNRVAFANFNDATTVISPQTEEQRARTNAAILNVHFRRAISMSLDRKVYNAQTVGDELALTSLRNCYTPGNFVFLEEEVTVDINGTATTYPAGTYYGKIMQDQIDADGVKITVWDPTAEAGVGSSDGFDGWYNAANAVEELDKAIAELAAEGIEISAENPIYLDLPTPSFSASYLNRSNAYKQSVEAALGGKVIINIVNCATADEWYYAGYDTSVGAEANYDIYDLSGWGPDYGDPQTYLDTMLDGYAGYMVKCLGIF